MRFKENNSRCRQGQMPAVRWRGHLKSSKEAGVPRQGAVGRGAAIESTGHGLDRLISSVTPP